MSLKELKAAYEAAKAHGDYQEFWRLRREYLLAQAERYTRRRRLRFLRRSWLYRLING